MRSALIGNWSVRVLHSLLLKDLGCLELTKVDECLGRGLEADTWFVELKGLAACVGWRTA